MFNFKSTALKVLHVVLSYIRALYLIVHILWITRSLTETTHKSGFMTLIMFCQQVIFQDKVTGLKYSYYFPNYKQGRKNKGQD